VSKFEERQIAASEEIGLEHKHYFRVFVDKKLNKGRTHEEYFTTA
jgi:hypothetical protein